MRRMKTRDQRMPLIRLNSGAVINVASIATARYTSKGSLDVYVCLSSKNGVHLINIEVYASPTAVLDALVTASAHKLARASRYTLMCPEHVRAISNEHVILASGATFEFEHKEAEDANIQCTSVYDMCDVIDDRDEEYDAATLAKIAAVARNLDQPTVQAVLLSEFAIPFLNLVRSALARPSGRVMYGTMHEYLSDVDLQAALSALVGPTYTVEVNHPRAWWAYREIVFKEHPKPPASRHQRRRQ